MLEASHEVEVASRNCQVMEEVLERGEYLPADDNENVTENLSCDKKLPTNNNVKLNFRVS